MSNPLLDDTDFNDYSPQDMNFNAGNPSDFPPSQADDVFTNVGVTPQNIHAASDSFEATVSDIVSDSGVSWTYTINDDNKWGWITLYVVTIVVGVLGNLLFIIGSLRLGILLTIIRRNIFVRKIIFQLVTKRIVLVIPN